MKTILICGRFHHQTLLKARLNLSFNIHHVQKLDEAKDIWNETQVLIIRSQTQVNDSLIRHFKNLELIVSATSGFDHIDMEIAKKIPICHLTETHKNAVADLTLLLLLAANRKINCAFDQMKKGVWAREPLIGQESSKKVFGIIGYGRVGKEVAQRAAAFGYSIHIFDPYLAFEESKNLPNLMGFEEVMRTSDIVSFHVPLTRRTHNMIKKETLEWIGPETTIINTSRGGIIREEDLITFLLKNPQARACLDVYNKEPLDRNSQLLKLPNVITTPHIGALTEEAFYLSSEAAWQRVESFFNGEKIQDRLPYSPQEIPWADDSLRF
jgi:D-3-phosphoglycerate dehydrogenase